MGSLFFLVNRRGRLAVEKNLHQVLGHRPSSTVVRQVFRQAARNYYDTFTIPTLGTAGLLELIRLRGLEHLDEALQAGHGAIIASVHLSSVALVGQAIAARGYPVTSVVERVQPPKLNRLLVQLRGGGGVRVLPLGRDLTRELLGTLRRNEIVGLVMDRDLAGAGVSVAFFGAEAMLPSGAAVLALRTGAPILPAVATRTAGDLFEGWIEHPIQVEPLLDRQESVRLTTQRIAARFEPHIAAHPEQWTVFQPLWRDSGDSPDRSSPDTRLAAHDRPRHERQGPAAQ